MTTTRIVNVSNVALFGWEIVCGPINRGKITNSRTARIVVGDYDDGYAAEAVT